MAKQRYVNTKFWSDSFIVDLNPLDRYLFLYLLTNEHTNIAGIYELPITRMAQETGIDKEMIPKMLRRLSGKVRHTQGWVIIKNFQKHQQAGEKIHQGIEKIMAELPLKIKEYYDNWQSGKDKVSIGSDRVSIDPELSESEFESESNKIAARAAEPVKKEKKNPLEPMSLKVFVSNCRASPRRYLTIIADYAEQKKPDFTTRGQWDVFIKRNLRPAQDLEPFTDEQIGKAVSAILKVEGDYLSKWTLETIYKYLTK